ncbi:MAG TPA: PIN domain-containing protein [Anaerolineae bacterium]|nr:PIN domain-containing protein [Anaerolineae bacterium]
MGLSIEFFLRLIGATISGVSFGFLGVRLTSAFTTDQDTALFYIFIFILLGILVGLVLTPYLTIRPLQYLRQQILDMPAARLLAILIGLFVGLLATAFITPTVITPIRSLLPPPLSELLPLGVAFTLCYAAILIFTVRQRDVQMLLQNAWPSWQQRSLRPAPSKPPTSTPTNNLPAATEPTEAITDSNLSPILLDTSVIIDGRITDIAATGFIRSEVIVPTFILLELQHIADSADDIRRNRGRRGMEVLTNLQENPLINITISDIDVSDVREADTKLIALARHFHAPIMTNDYNLNRIADLQGVLVLNINDLANSLKAVYLPGENLNVKVIQEGKEHGQGVGYLEDGTMVVIEDGRNHLRDKVDVTVTKVLQTTAGRMIFARIEDD